MRPQQALQASMLEADLLRATRGSVISDRISLPNSGLFSSKRSSLEPNGVTPSRSGRASQHPLDLENLMRRKKKEDMPDYLKEVRGLHSGSPRWDIYGVQKLYSPAA